MNGTSEDEDEGMTVPIIRVKGHCYCGEPFSLNLRSNHQILDVYRSNAAPGKDQLGITCKKCRKRSIVEIGLGRESGALRHPLERIVESASGGRREGRIFVFILFPVFFLMVLPVLIGLYFGLSYRTFNEDWNLGNAILAFFLILTYFYILKRLRKWYGAAEDNIPPIYKYHVQKNFELTHSGAFFFLIFLIVVTVLVSSNSFVWVPNHVLDLTEETEFVTENNITFQRTVTNDTLLNQYRLMDFPGKAWGWVVILSLFCQLFIGILFFMMGMILPKYIISIRKPEKDYEDFMTEINEIRKTLYFIIVLEFLALPFGIIYYDIMLRHKFEPGSYLLTIVAMPLTTFIILYYFGSRLEQRVRDWHSQSYETERFISIEIIPIGESSRVEVESLVPPASGAYIVPKVLLTREELLKEFRETAEMGTELAALSGMVTSSKQRAEFDSKRDAIWRTLNSLGEKIFQTYFRERARDAFIVGAKGGKGKLTIMFRCVGEDSGLPWELLLFELNPICLEHRAVRIHSHSPNIESSSLAAEKILIIACGETQDESFTPLPLVESEGEAVRAAAEKAGYAVLLLKGKDANRKNVLDQIMKGEYQILHFCGHSIFNREEPKYSALVLQDGKLTAQEIASIVKDKCPLQLVFLGSCFSGGKDPLSTTEVNGVSDAFLAAGVPYVVGMQWAVTDEGLKLLSSTFYQAVSRGDSVEEAVRKARIRAKEEWSGRDPVWAAPVLYKY